jgi:hypothetical protein
MGHGTRCEQGIRQRQHTNLWITEHHIDSDVISPHSKALLGIQVAEYACEKIKKTVFRKTSAARRCVKP